MRREGPKENMKNAFILIKFEKLKLISISPFYQILSGPLNRQGQAHCPVCPGALGTTGHPRIIWATLGLKRWTSRPANEAAQRRPSEVGSLRRPAFRCIHGTIYRGV